MPTNKRIRTVLYGDQKVSSTELEVLHTPIMQRLYDLHQLGFTDRVYIDASHARLQHVVGVVEQVSKITTAMTRNLRQRPERVFSIGTAERKENWAASDLALLVARNQPVARMIGLLHDLTHAPYGHTIEDEIQLTESRHDHPDRQAEAFYLLLCQLFAWRLSDCGQPIPESLSPFLSGGYEAPPPPTAAVIGAATPLVSNGVAGRSAFLKSLAVLRKAMNALLHLEALHSTNLKKAEVPTGPYAFEMLISGILQDSDDPKAADNSKFEPHRDAFLLDVVGNTVCADLLDYAKRDCHFASLDLGFDDVRLTENFTLVSFCADTYDKEHGVEHNDEVTRPFQGWCFRAAISLFSHKYRTDMPGELANLLNVRLYLYERVVFHGTKTAAGAMLGSALQLIGWRLHDTKKNELPKSVRFLGDAVFLHDVYGAAAIATKIIGGVTAAERIGEPELSKAQGFADCHTGLVGVILQLRMGQKAADANGEIKAGLFLLSRLRARHFMKPVFRALANSWDTRLQGGSANLSEKFKDPDVRYVLERRIEKEAGLAMGAISVHCPRGKTAEKIANVLLVKLGTKEDDGADEVRKLRDIDQLDPSLFGRHAESVRAAEQTYKSLWRLTVFVAPDYSNQAEKIEKVAGRVIFDMMDVHQHFAGQTLEWRNDQALQTEIKLRAARDGDHSDPTLLFDESGPANQPISEAAMKVALAFDERRVQGTEESLEVMAKVVSLLQGSVSTALKETASADTEDLRWRMVEAIFDAEVKLSTRTSARLKRRYAAAASKLSRRAFESRIGQIQSKADKTPSTLAVHRSGDVLKSLVAAFDKAFGVSESMEADFFASPEE